MHLLTKWEERVAKYLTVGHQRNYGRLVNTSDKECLETLSSTNELSSGSQSKECLETLSSTNELSSGSQRGGGGGSLWSPGALKFFVVEPGAQSLSRLGIRTKMVLFAKWSPRVKQWSGPRAPNCPPWSRGALHFLGRSLQPTL